MVGFFTTIAWFSVNPTPNSISSSGKVKPGLPTSGTVAFKATPIVFVAATIFSPKETSSSKEAPWRA